MIHINLPRHRRSTSWELLITMILMANFTVYRRTSAIISKKERSIPLKLAVTIFTFPSLVLGVHLSFYTFISAHRTLIVRELKGLQDIISVTNVKYTMSDMGWAFPEGDECPDAQSDPLYGAKYIRDIYLRAGKDCRDLISRRVIAVLVPGNDE